MRKSPVALAIGGLDPCAGAGVLLDVRALRAAGAWAAAVCACLTVQSPRGLVSVQPVDCDLLEAQLDLLFRDMQVRAVKTGALGSIDNLRLVGRYAAKRRRMVWVVDPLMMPSRGEVNLAPKGDVQALQALLSLATLATPNLPEAETILGVEIAPKDAREAAVMLSRRFGCALLLKGGHMSVSKGASSQTISDWLAFAGETRELRRHRAVLPEVHGSGCALASLIAGRLSTRDGRTKTSIEELAAACKWAATRLLKAMKNSEKPSAGMHLMGTL